MPTMGRDLVTVGSVNGAAQSPSKMFALLLLYVDQLELDHVLAPAVTVAA